MLPSVNKALNRVIKDLQIVTAVIGKFPLEDNAEDYVVEGKVPSYATPLPFPLTEPTIKI